jgi:hypothetical protein
VFLTNISIFRMLPFMNPLRGSAQKTSFSAPNHLSLRKDNARIEKITKKIPELAKTGK